MTLLETLRAIKQRIRGEFDAPELLKFGALAQTKAVDVVYLAEYAIKCIKDSDSHSMDAIAKIMSDDDDWSADTLEAIAGVVKASGRKILDREDKPRVWTVSVEDMIPVVAVSHEEAVAFARAELVRRLSDDSPIHFAAEED